MLEKFHKAFTIEEANTILPTLNEAFCRILQLHHCLQKHIRMLSSGYREKIFLSLQQPLSTPNADFLSKNQEIKLLVHAIFEEIQELTLLGCNIQSIKQGLVNLKLKDTDNIMLSWMFGEKEISYWQNVHASEEVKRQPLEDLPS
jgi:hypothetical protein